MRSTIFFLAALFVLPGCFLLGRMEDSVDKTNLSVADSNKLIGETKDGQQLALALELMSSSEKSTNLRAAASETVFKMAAEDRIWKYIGMPAPFNLRTISKAGVDLPNVTVIGDGIDPVLGVATVSPELYAVQSFAAYSLLEQMTLKSKAPGLSPEDTDTLRNNLVRIVNVSTGLLGGAKATDIKKALATKGPRPFEKDLAVRQSASQMISDLLRMLSAPEDTVSDARSKIDSRLGVGSY